MPERTAGWAVVTSLLDRPNSVVRIVSRRLVDSGKYDPTNHNHYKTVRHYKQNYSRNGEVWGPAAELIDMLSFCRVVCVNDQTIEIVVGGESDAQVLTMVLQALAMLSKHVPDVEGSMDLLFNVCLISDDRHTQRRTLLDIKQVSNNITYGHVLLSRHRDYFTPISLDLLDIDDGYGTLARFNFPLHGRGNDIKLRLSIVVDEIQAEPAANIWFRLSENDPWSVLETASLQRMREIIESRAFAHTPVDYHRRVLKRTKTVYDRESMA